MISLFRKLQYQEIAKLNLNGKIIDLGGSRKSGYHELIKGNCEFIVANLSDYYGYDIKVDLENSFPLEDNSFDNALAINLIEHIYNYKNLFQETNRILKENGLFVITIPFMFHKHGCPNDYNRFTDEALKRMASECGFKVVKIKELGEGIFSVFYQMMPFPNFSRYLLEPIFVFMDLFLKKINKGYKKISVEYPLGYFVVLKKK